MTDCTEYEVLLSARLDGELIPEEAARLDAHLSTCPSCQALAAELEALHAELEDMAPIPPASLAKNVMEQVRAEAATIPFPAKSKPKKHWKRCGALAAALVLVIVGGSRLAFSPCGSAGDMAETAAVAMEPAEEEAAPTEECAEAEPAEAAEEPAALSDADSPSYGYAADDGSSLKPKTAVASGSGNAPADVPTEDAVMEAPAMEEAEEEAPCEAAPAEMATPSSANTASPLTEEEARSLLRHELNARGGDWTVTDSGRSADGTAWLFTAGENANRLTHRFSVSVENGQVTELPPLR